MGRWGLTSNPIMAVNTYEVTPQTFLRSVANLQTLPNDQMAYYIGDTATNQASFYKNGAVTDPTAVTYKIYQDGILLASYTYGVDAQLVKSSPGIYYVDWPVAATGLYWWVMTGTGLVAARNWDSFSCNPDPAP